MRLRTLLAACVLMATSLSARADQLFNLSNVTLSTGLAGSGVNVGTLTGSFTTNDALTMVTSFNLTASAAGSFAGFSYTPATASVTASVLPLQYFRLDDPGSINELQLYFHNGGLTSTGGSFSSFLSYEYEPSGGVRYLSGSVVAAGPAAATPEPSSLVLLGTGVLGMVGFIRRRMA